MRPHYKQDIHELLLLMDRVASSDLSLNNIDASERTRDVCHACIAYKGCACVYVLASVGKFEEEEPQFVRFTACQGKQTSCNLVTKGINLCLPLVAAECLSECSK